MSGTVSFTQITLAAIRVNAMVKFYNTVLHANLQLVDAELDLYEGVLVNIPLLICTNMIAKVQADQARHQFHFGVPDLAAAIEHGIAAGGKIHEDIEFNEGIKSVVLLDPDGNTLELIEVTPRLKIDYSAIQPNQ